MQRLIAGKPGLIVNTKCKMIRKSLAGGYHFKRVSVGAGQERFRDAPNKNEHSHVGDAILELFKRRENIDIFNKKALFIYIKEITDAPTPVITKVIKVLKEIYRDMLNKYLEEGTRIDIFSR